MIPYGRQDISQDDIDAVEEVLRSDWLTQGPMVPKFERTVADYCGAKYAVAVNSATSALHLACLALGLGKGDALWTSPNTFVASANCALYCGADVDFVDIDPRTYNLCASALEIKLVEAELLGNLPKIVIPVHFAGQSCDMKKINELSRKYGFYVVEDASHAIGGEYLGNKIGGGQYSDITVFSFHPVKIITTAEGGVAVTNTDVLAQKMRLLREHGITRDTDLMSGGLQGKWIYEQVYLGFNYRMNDLQAALGISQFKLLNGVIDKREKIVSIYRREFAGLPILLPYESPECSSSWHLFVIQFSDRAGLYGYLRSRGVQVNVHYIPVYYHSFYRKLGFNRGLCPVAERYYEGTLTLPLFQALDKKTQILVCNYVHEYFE